MPLTDIDVDVFVTHEKSTIHADLDALGNARFTTFQASFTGEGERYLTGVVMMGCGYLKDSPYLHLIPGMKYRVRGNQWLVSGTTGTRHLRDCTITTPDHHPRG